MDTFRWPWNPHLSQSYCRKKHAFRIIGISAREENRKLCQDFDHLLTKRLIFLQVPEGIGYPGWGKPEKKPAWWPSDVPWTKWGVQRGIKRFQLEKLVTEAMTYHGGKLPDPKEKVHFAKSNQKFTFCHEKVHIELNWTVHPAFWSFLQKPAKSPPLKKAKLEESDLADVSVPAADDSHLDEDVTVHLQEVQEGQQTLFVTTQPVASVNQNSQQSSEISVRHQEEQIRWYSTDLTTQPLALLFRRCGRKSKNNGLTMKFTFSRRVPLEFGVIEENKRPLVFWETGCLSWQGKKGGVSGWPDGWYMHRHKNSQLRHDGCLGWQCRVHKDAYLFATIQIFTQVGKDANHQSVLCVHPFRRFPLPFRKVGAKRNAKCLRAEKKLDRSHHGYVSIIYLVCLVQNTFVQKQHIWVQMKSSRFGNR